MRGSNDRRNQLTMAKPSDRNAAPIVLADVGGTNVRFAVLTGGVLGPVLHLAVRDHAQFSDALAVFLDRQLARATIRSAIFAVAGVGTGGTCAPTQYPGGVGG